jgi:hypothetical protein
MVALIFQRTVYVSLESTEIEGPGQFVRLSHKYSPVYRRIGFDDYWVVYGLARGFIAIKIFISLHKYPAEPSYDEPDTVKKRSIAASSHSTAGIPCL